jgi:tRNA (guanine-N7-)-methyltransferase
MRRPMNENERYTGAFFGRRKGKPLRAHQADLIATLLPHLAVDLSRPPENVRDLFSPPAAIVRLEIGFGGAEHLIAQAQAHPDTGFIGIEPFVNGMAKALAEIERNGLRNIRLHHGDATDLIAWLPDGAITRIDMLYPDPWPKRRHWKRRFINERSVENFARVLKRGGEFRFASDWAGYAEWTLRRVIQSPFFDWTAQRAADWREPWSGFGGTRYEAKAKREGRAPCYLTFVRK